MVSFNKALYKQAVLNDLRCYCPLIVGTATAFLVNKVAHSIFKCDKDSYASWGIRLTSFAAGTAAGVYAGRFFPLHPFAGKEVWAIVKVFLPINIILCICRIPLPALGVGGALWSLGGQYSLPALAVLGSVNGVAFSSPRL